MFPIDYSAILQGLFQPDDRGTRDRKSTPAHIVLVAPANRDSKTQVSNLRTGDWSTDRTHGIRCYGSWQQHDQNMEYGPLRPHRQLIKSMGHRSRLARFDKKSQEKPFPIENELGSGLSCWFGRFVEKRGEPEGLSSEADWFSLRAKD